MLLLRSEPMRRPRAMSILAALAFLGACGGPFEEADLADDRELPADVRRLEVRIPLGSITVHAGPAGRLRLAGRSRKTAGSEADLEKLRAVEFVPRLEAADEPGTWVYSFPDLPPGLDEREAAMMLRAELYLPRDLDVDVETRRGHLSVIGRDADVRLRTGSGSIQVEELEGSLEAFTGLGSGILHGIRGSVAMESGGGALLVYIERIGPGGVRLRTREPSITVYLPADASFDLDARVLRSNEGKIGVRDSFGVPVRAEGDGHVARGAVGGGGPPVVLESGSGWVSVPVLEPRETR